MTAIPVPRLLGVMLDVTPEERGRIMAYAYQQRRSVDDAVRDATLTVVDAAAASAARGATSGRDGGENGHVRSWVTANPSARVGSSGNWQLPGRRTCGDSSREVLRLDLLVRTLRETLQVARGQVLTDAVIEQRARNAAQAVDYAMAAFDDDETLPA